MDPEHMKKAGRFKELSGEVADTYKAWQKSVMDEEGSPFDRKTMELMGLAAAAAVQCKYCVEAHSQKAKKHGATQEEMAKAIQIASVVGAGSTVAYGLEGLDAEE